jgi:hypothetical protein
VSYCISWDKTAIKEGVAIAIKKFSEDQLHLGILCKDEESSDIIHLSGHFSLRKSVHLDQYNYVNITQLSNIDHTHMLAYILSVLDQNQATIPYGPCDGGGFDQSGAYSGNVGDGLTCSSFVVTSFESQGFDFIDKSTWPEREDDKNWQEMIIGDFRREHADSEESIAHFDKQLRKIGALRYRPHEVAASVTFSDYKKSFEDIAPISLKIKNEVLGISSVVNQGDEVTSFF